MTDGSSCRYHLQWKNYTKVEPNIGDTRESYVYSLSKLFHTRYDYSIVECAYHANSFYYRLELKKPNEIQFKHFPAGSSKLGLRRLKWFIISDHSNHYLTRCKIASKISVLSQVSSQEKEMKNNPYIDPPSAPKVIGWLALLIFTFWALVWGIKYLVIGIIWLVDSIWDMLRV